VTGERTAGDQPLPGGNFRLFITRLGYQALMSLGIIENPLTGTKEQNLPNARMLLDDLAMLQAKTEGNLDPEEREHLEKLVRDLRQACERAGG
jgi:hypothetical protein